VFQRTPLYIEKLLFVFGKDLNFIILNRSGVASICCEEGKTGNYVMGNSRRTSELGAAAAR